MALYTFVHWTNIMSEYLNNVASKLRIQQK